MAWYRNERIPDWGFVQKLKRVDPNLYVCFDSRSLRWDILYKSPSGAVFHVHRVCKRDEHGRDRGYQPLDDRTITKLLRMDLQRRNMSPLEYVQGVRRSEHEQAAASEHRLDDHRNYLARHERRALGLAFDALHGVFRRH